MFAINITRTHATVETALRMAVETWTRDAATCREVGKETPAQEPAMETLARQFERQIEQAKDVLDLIEAGACQ